MTNIIHDKLNIAMGILFLFGFLIRLVFATLPGFKIDVDAWFAWAVRLQEVGFANFYSDIIFTIFAPGYLYILSLLGFIKNLFNIDKETFYLVVKLPNIISEIILAILAYKITKDYSLKIARIVTIVIILNPGFIFNSSIWGQTDSTLALFLLITVYLLKKDKLIMSSIFLGLSFLIKPQAIAILPVFALFALNDFSSKIWLKLIVPGFFTIFILSIPFFPNNPFLELIQFFQNSVNEYQGTSLFAYNYWGIFGFWLNDTQKIGFLTLQQWGFVLFSGYWLIILYFFLKKRFPILFLATLATLSFYFLPTRVHERYLYSGLVFLILLSAYTKNKLLIILTAALNIIYFLNLYYVYIYYNHFYLNLPSPIFWNTGYSLIETNGKLLSIIATFCFVCISFLIIRLNKSKNV